MKTFGIAHLLLFILLLLVYQCTCAQDFFVSTRGDTVKGEVKQIAFGPEKKVRVTTAAKKKHTFSIFQTRSFTDRGESFVPAKGPQGYVFMKVKKSGYLSLLSFQQDNQTSYDGLFLMKRDGSGVEVPGLTFKKIMTRFVSDCPEVSARIGDGALGRSDIEQIVDEYNRCIEGTTAAHNKVAAQYQEQSKKISAWDVLEEKVNGLEQFQGRQDALEMITDIKGKIKRNEKIPNFLLQALKENLSNTGLSLEVDNALKEAKQ